MPKSRIQKSPNPQTLYRVAEQQAGYFTARQATETGFSWERLSYYAKNGRFLRVGHGIYRFSQYPSSPFEDLFAAWLRAGPNSVISHESALAVYDLSDVIPTEIHVTVPRSASRRRKAIRQHTSRLSLTQVVRREGLPLTSVPRTIADVAKAGLAEEQVRQAIREALDRGLTNERALLLEATRRGGRAARLIKSELAQLTVQTR
jgi:predicted transcriptional regulator of viral defense system